PRTRPGPPRPEVGRTPRERVRDPSPARGAGDGEGRFHAGAAPSACPAPRVPAAVPRGRCGPVAGRRTPRVPVLRRRSPSRRPRTGVRPVAGRGTARRGGGVSGGLPGQ